MTDHDDEADANTDLARSPDRERGILTPSDREFLLGRKTDYTDHSRKQKRNRIRRRLRNAILDFSILFEHLEPRDRETVFDPDDEHRDVYTQGITDMLAFLHLGTMGYHTPFKHMLSRGVNKAEQELTDSDYRMVTVEFNVDPVGRINVDEVVDKLAEDEFEELTDEELRAFVRLLGESDEFESTAVRSEMKAQMDEFVQEVDEAADRRQQRLDELND
jgi:succinate dehydrogenase flavin-adding protein (antitoxin of CptAB toxin-antitoxin module)